MPGLTIPSNQTRYLDPYQAAIYQYGTTDSKLVIARQINLLLKIFGNNIIFDIDENGITTSVSGPNLTINFPTFRVLADSTFIEVGSSSSMTFSVAALGNDSGISSDAEFEAIKSDTKAVNDDRACIAVFLNYRYIESTQPNNVKLEAYYAATNGSFTPVDGSVSTFDTSRHLIPIAFVYYKKDSSDNITYRKVITRDNYLVSPENPNLDNPKIKYVSSGTFYYYLFGVSQANYSSKDYFQNLMRISKSITFNNLADGPSAYGNFRGGTIRLLPIRAPNGQNIEYVRGITEDMIWPADIAEIQYNPSTGNVEKVIYKIKYNTSGVSDGRLEVQYTYNSNDDIYQERATFKYPFTDPTISQDLYIKTYSYNADNSLSAVSVQSLI